MPKFPTLFHLPSWRTLLVGVMIGWSIHVGWDWCWTFCYNTHVCVRETASLKTFVGR